MEHNFNQICVKVREHKSYIQESSPQTSTAKHKKKHNQSHTHPRMRNQMMLQRERHLALVTAVRAVRRVKQQMRVETVLPRKRLAAVRANVRPLPYE